MAAVIIRKKDVERLGHTLLKEVYDFLHDEYILTEFEDMKKEKEKFLRNLVLNKFNHYNFTKIKTETSCETKYEDYDENKFEDDLKCVKEEIENGTMDIHVIFNTLFDLNLDMEIEENLYFKTKSFIDIFKVSDNGYIYLED